MCTFSAALIVDIKPARPPPTTIRCFSAIKCHSLNFQSILLNAMYYIKAIIAVTPIYEITKNTINETHVNTVVILEIVVLPSN